MKSQQNRIELVTRPDRLQDFRIHPLTGDVTVARLLDREVRDEYALKVQATDGAWKLETVITGECTLNYNTHLKKIQWHIYAYIFQKAQVTLNKNAHNLQYHFGAQFFMLFHME